MKAPRTDHKGLIVTPDRGVILRRIRTDTPDATQAIVGGELSIIAPSMFMSIAVHGWHAYVNGAGITAGLPNGKAMLLATRAGWLADDWLCGNVVFFGNGEDGDEADVPLELLRLGAELGLWGLAHAG